MRWDAHIHSALSACADNPMSPRRIVETAKARQLDRIAVTDHNASAHVALCAHWAQRFGLDVVPGIEVTSREEVHLLAFFPEIEMLRDFQALIDAHLPDRPNVPEIFGHQVCYDAEDEIVALDERLRQVGCALGIERLVDAVHQRRGRIVPAHVDRARNGLIAQLGFIDRDAGYDAVELTWKGWRNAGHHVGDCLEGYPLWTGSDAHFLEDIGRGAMETTLVLRGGNDDAAPCTFIDSQASLGDFPC